MDEFSNDSSHGDGWAVLLRFQEAAQAAAQSWQRPTCTRYRLAWNRNALVLGTELKGLQRRTSKFAKSCWAEILAAVLTGDPLGQHANLGVNMHSSVSEMQTLWYNM